MDKQYATQHIYARPNSQVPGTRLLLFDVPGGKSFLVGWYKEKAGEFERTRSTDPIIEDAVTADGGWKALETAVRALVDGPPPQAPEPPKEGATQIGLF